MELAPLEELRRTRRQLEPANPDAPDRQREKDVRVAERFMIEKVLRSSAEVVSVNGPTSDRNRGAELMLFVALAAQGNEVKALGQRELEQWPGNCRERRRLIETSIEPV